MFGLLGDLRVLNACAVTVIVDVLSNVVLFSVELLLIMNCCNMCLSIDFDCYVIQSCVAHAPILYLHCWLSSRESIKNLINTLA